MQMTVKKWGNSSGLVLPKYMLESLGIKTGDEVNAELVNGKIVLEKTEPKELTFEELFKDYDGQIFTSKIQEFEPTGEEKW